MKKLLRAMDKPLFFSIFVMSVFGLIMIFSASYVTAFVKMGNAYQYLIRQGIILLIGFALFFFIIKIPSNFYKKIAYPYLYIVFGLLVGLFLYGKIGRGVQSWYDLGFFNLQPSEFAKTALIVLMGVYYQKHKDNKDNYKVALMPLFYAFIICFLVFVQPDLGTMLIIVIIGAFTYASVPIAKKIKKKINMVLFSGVALLSTIMLLAVLNGNQILTSAQLQRFNFLDPCERYMEAGTGYQVCNGYIAINNGGLFGVGIGNSTQKYLYLPEAHTDFIFPVIIEELGLLVGIIILLLYIFILYRILLIAKKSYTLMNSIICYGVAIYIFAHIFINLVGVLGILPLTGVPLPFLSYGGSYTINLILSIAMVERIAIENNNNNKDIQISKKIKENN
jgi:cell division protein FtsW